MAKNFVLSFLFIFSLLCSYTSAQPSETLFSPVTADANLPLFSLTLNTNEQYFISISAPFLVRRCDDNSSRPTVACASFPCIQTLVFNPEICPLPNNTVINGRCTCQATAFDPFSSQCASNLFTNGDFVISSRNITNVYYLCAPAQFVAILPAGVFGVAGLSPSTIGVWNQFAPSNNKKFALCLPSTDNSTDGVIFFGGGPYKLATPTTILDASRILTYTPLIRNPKILNNYYIGVKGISVDGVDIAVRPNAFGFDLNGNGSVTLSTVVQYTTLRSDIYTPFINAFSNATVQIPRAPNVNPFELCLQRSSIGSGQVGLNVPRIDLRLISGNNFTVFGANSMKRVSADVACLAFVDGGATAKQAVVIGTYQMEDNLLLFDLGKSALGFSSSLKLVNSSCSNFQT